MVGIYVFLRRKRNWSYDLHALATQQVAYISCRENPWRDADIWKKSICYSDSLFPLKVSRAKIISNVHCSAEYIFHTHWPLALCVSYAWLSARLTFHMSQDQYSAKPSLPAQTMFSCVGRHNNLSRTDTQFALCTLYREMDTLRWNLYKITCKETRSS